MSPGADSARVLIAERALEPVNTASKPVNQLHSMQQQQTPNHSIFPVAE